MAFSLNMPKSQQGRGIEGPLDAAERLQEMDDMHRIPAVSEEESRYFGMIGDHYQSLCMSLRGMLASAALARGFSFSPSPQQWMLVS